MLESSRLWREVAVQVGAEDPSMRLEHQLVDSCAMRLITAPRSFDVVVTENMFGDILTDEAAVIAGSLGLLPERVARRGTRGLYEPIHGSAPDIAGKGIANPLGTIMSVAMLLRHSLGLEEEARAVESGGRPGDHERRAHRRHRRRQAAVDGPDGRRGARATGVGAVGEATDPDCRKGPPGRQRRQDPLRSLKDGPLPPSGDPFSRSRNAFTRMGDPLARRDARDHGRETSFMVHR